MRNVNVVTLHRKALKTIVETQWIGHALASPLRIQGKRRKADKRR